MYLLNKLAYIQSDMDLFEHYVDKGFSLTDADDALAYLLKANAMYRGAPFEEFRHVDWLAQKKEALERKYVRMHEKIAQHYLTLEQFEQAIHWAERLVHIDKTWEEAYRILMIAYFELQNRPQSMKWYDICKRVLKDELNIEPIESTTPRYESIIDS